MHLQVVRGPRITTARSACASRAASSAGRRRLTFLGRDVDDPDSDLFGALVDTIIIGGDDEGDATGREGARTLDQLAERIDDLARYDGVRASARLSRASVDLDLAICGGARRPPREARAWRKRRLALKRAPLTHPKRKLQGEVPSTHSPNPKGVPEVSRTRRARGGLHPGRAEARRRTSSGRIAFSSSAQPPTPETLHHQPRRQRPAQADRQPGGRRAVRLGADGRDIAYRIRKPGSRRTSRSRAWTPPGFDAARRSRPRAWRRASRRGSRSQPILFRRSRPDASSLWTWAVRQGPGGALRPAGPQFYPPCRPKETVFATPAPTGDTDRAIERSRHGRALFDFPGAYDSAPAWSPDGTRSRSSQPRRLRRQPGGDLEIWVMDADGPRHDAHAQRDRTTRAQPGRRTGRCSRTRAAPTNASRHQRDDGRRRTCAR